MREGIHPEYPPAAVTCACGNAFTTRSTRGDFSIDVCAACHPFYTGTQKLMDTAGRVDRFRKRYGDAKQADAKVAGAAAQAKSEQVEKTAKEKKPKKAAAAPADAPAADAPAAEAPAAETTES